MRELERDLPPQPPPPRPTRRRWRSSAPAESAVRSRPRSAPTARRCGCSAGARPSGGRALRCSAYPTRRSPISPRRSLPPRRSRRFVGHTSGAAGLDALAAATEAGAATFSVHPLQTFPDGATDLTGCPCAISGSDDEALSYARALAERLGMRPFEVDEQSRAAYHAAASIASNFLVALEESAAGLLARVGVDEARELLTPFVLRAAANWAELGPRALTGPIARGDSETVRRHLVALREHAPELIGLYEELAERARAVAAEQAPQRTGAAPR